MTLPANKHGPTVIGRFQGEAKTVDKTIETAEIYREGGFQLILKRLDKAYAVDKTNKLDNNLVDFLYYSWKNEVSVEHFISGFHTRLEMFSDLNLDDKRKGHLLHRQTDLAYHKKHVVIGASSGRHEINRVTAGLRNIYGNSTPSNASKMSSFAAHGSTGTGHPYSENNGGGNLNGIG